MKAAKGAFPRAADRPDANVRLYLFHGPDEGQSRALAARLLAGLRATRFVIEAGAVKADPALLPDEAGAMSLFGGARAIWVEPAGDDIVEGASALLDGPAGESPVVAIAGALRKGSALLKLAEGHKSALAFASYAPEGAGAERMVVELGRTEGLKITPPVAARIAASCGNDQAIVAQELFKIALFLGATPETPREVDHSALDAIGADLPEGDFMRLADLALSGDLQAAADELARLSPSGTEAVPILRSLQRRLLMLAPARARVEAGERPAEVMASIEKSLFWKDKTLVSKLIATWDAGRLAKVAERVGRLERQLMLSGLPAAEGLGEEVVAIAREARRR